MAMLEGTRRELLAAQDEASKAESALKEQEAILVKRLKESDQRIKRLQSQSPSSSPSPVTPSTVHSGSGIPRLFSFPYGFHPGGHPPHQMGGGFDKS